ncbi:MAG: hypothetical protein IPH18_15835 [Chitinophagaceae bacterium]|nr:hypothetical protein [Chitinophagaceae bacterium]MBK8953056.1 hypothetical protein [Chitinophagaceae bacterium]
MEFDPPVKERKSKELFNIISNDEMWAKEIQLLAEEELFRRNFTQEEINYEKNRKFNTIKKLRERQSKKIEKNKTESYTAIEMMLILVFFPFTLLLHMNPLSEFWELDAGNYYKKIWQRAILIIVSVFIWIQIIIRIV